MNIIPVRKNVTYQQLMAEANPSNPRQPQSLPWTLYDTQQYPAAGTQNLTFFASSQADKTLSNMETGGQLSDPQFFEVWYIQCDFLRAGPTTDAGLVGQANDIELVLKTARATWLLDISNKLYGRFPLRQVHASGGAIGPIGGTTAAGGTIQLAQNGIVGGGWWVGGEIIIPPKVGFNFQLLFQSTLVPIAVATNIVISLVGVLHRRVS